jgi:hypothetical protein
MTRQPTKSAFFDSLPSDIRILYAKAGENPEKEICRILRAFAEHGAKEIPARIQELEEKQILPGTETHRRLVEVLEQSEEMNRRASDALKATQSLSKIIRNQFPK